MEGFVSGMDKCEALAADVRDTRAIKFPAIFRGKSGSHPRRDENCVYVYSIVIQFCYASYVRVPS